MRLLDLTMPTPAENLALDEALLESRPAHRESLRVWESPGPMVVIGRSSRVAEEVNLQACRLAGAPVLRRASGGAAVVAGPGCLMYAVVLDLVAREELKAIDRAHAWVLQRVAAALRPAAPSVCMAGKSDLAVAGPDGVLRKISGNSLRVRRTRLLYHGSVLYDFDLPLVARLLREPQRQPEYRARRPHGQFLTNVSIDRTAIVDGLARAFGAGQRTTDYPSELTAELARDKYENDGWNLSR